MSQVINDVLDESGNETYSGGFSSGNWVNATDYGFSSNHAGNEAFLSAYSGPPLPSIGMEKPIGGVIANTTYRVSFYVSMYANQPIPYSEFWSLYVGSENGTSVWDTVPTPSQSYVWLRWSGTFTPDAGDIGQPFVFGFDMQLLNNRSIAIDGPLTVEDLATGVVEHFDIEQPLQVWFEPGSSFVTVNSTEPLNEVMIVDAQGRYVASTRPVANGSIMIAVDHLTAGQYCVRSTSPDGAVQVGRFVKW
jgi:hypothetical protein